MTTLCQETYDLINKTNLNIFNSLTKYNERGNHLLVLTLKELTKLYTQESRSKNESTLENNISTHHRPIGILYYG